MKATCPNGCENTTYSTTVHVQELWEVNESGDWVETLENLDISFPPSPDNLWFCRKCGAKATVTE